MRRKWILQMMEEQMKWSKDNKQKLFNVLKKLDYLEHDDWNKRIDKLGITRLIRRAYGRKRHLYKEEIGGFYNRDSACVQISNPWWNEKQNGGSQHLLAIPKELAEKLMVFGEVPLK